MFTSRTNRASTAIGATVGVLLILFPVTLPGLQHSLQPGLEAGPQTSAVTPAFAATYVGGSGTEFSAAIARDEAGHVYVTGYTASPDFPTTARSSTPVLKGKNDVFVMKFDANLRTVLASTSIGGAGDDCAYSILYDPRGFVYVAGYTDSKDFPTTPNAYARTYAGGAGDAFVLKMDRDLKTLVASTYLGGSATEDDWESPEIVLDRQGRLVVAGRTSSADFPTTRGASSEKYNGGSHDAFVSILDADLTRVLASTFVGGRGGDGVKRSLRVAPRTGEIVLAGVTLSTDFPTTGGPSTKAGGLGGFVVKMSPDLARINASAVLEGAIVMSLLVHRSGDVYVGGHAGQELPTSSNAFYRAFDKHDDQGFISRFTGDLSRLESSTVLPGTYLLGGGGVACLGLEEDRDGNIVSVGWTSARDFPTTPGAFDETHNGGNDTFVLTMDPGLTTLLASTFVGGSQNERWHKMTTDGAGRVYVGGYTLSKDFPTTAGAAFEKYQGGGADGFIARIDGGAAPKDGEALHHAAKRNDLAQVTRLLTAAKVSPDGLDRHRRTALHGAARYGAADAAGSLIAQGASVSIRDERGDTPLHLACMFGHQAVADLLAAGGADVNALNEAGASPLSLAAVYAPPVIVRWLLSHGADPTLGDKDGNAPLHLAASYGRLENVRAIVQQRADVDLRNGAGNTPLQLTVGNQYYEGVMKVLLDHGASLSATDRAGKTVLHIAASFLAHRSYMQLLLERGADPNLSDADGNTPLHLVLMESLRLKGPYPNMVEKAEMLVRRGANPTSRNKAGKSPRDLAGDIGNPRLSDLLSGR